MAEGFSFESLETRKYTYREFRKYVFMKRRNDAMGRKLTSRAVGILFQANENGLSHHIHLEMVQYPAKRRRRDLLCSRLVVQKEHVFRQLVGGLSVADGQLRGTQTSSRSNLGGWSRERETKEIGGHS